MQYPVIEILQLILSASMLIAWAAAFVSASLSYNSVLSFRRGLVFSTRMYMAVIVLLFSFVAAILSSHGFNFMELLVCEVFIFALAAALFILLSIRVLKLNSQVSRVMDATALSTRVQFNFYQFMAVASISIIAIRFNI